MTSTRAGAVVLTEVGLRDGLQLESRHVPPAIRAELAAALAEAGCPRIEVGAFVSPAAVPAMAGSAEVVALLRGRCTAELQVLVANARGVKEAAAAGVDTVNVVVATTESMNQRNTRRSVDEALAVVEQARGSAEQARVAAILATAFGCPYEGPVDPGVSAALVDRLVEAGAQRVTLADTIGAAGPHSVGALVERVRARHPELDLGFHAHDTRGMGLVNVLAAVRAGATGIDASLGGLGGCPFAGRGAAGNVASEEVIGLFEDLGEPTGVDLDAVAGCSTRLEEVLGHPLPSRRLALFKATGSAR